MRPGTSLERPPPVLSIARSRAWLTSIALHAVLALALVFGAVFTWHTKPEPVHSVQAYVARGAVSARPPAPAPQAPAPVAEATPIPTPIPAPTPSPMPATPAPVTPAPVTPAPSDAQQRAAKAQAQAAASEAAALKAQTLKAEAARAQAARETALAEQKAAQAKKDAEAKARAEAAAQKQRAEAALAAQLAQEKADLASRKQRETDLARQLAAEEHADALTAAQAGLLARYKAEITGRVQRAWIRPPTAKAGLRCIVHVTQVPGGTVTGAQVGECNADAAVRQSIKDAVMRASPLPLPPDPSLFDRNLTLEFAPDG